MQENRLTSLDQLRSAITAARDLSSEVAAAAAGAIREAAETKQDKFTTDGTMTLQSTVQNQQEDISRIEQTATDIKSTVQSHTGDISQIWQKAEAIQAIVANQDNEISVIKQTAKSIQTTVSNQEARIGTMIEQTVDNISLSVEDNGSTSSVIKLMRGGILMSSASITVKGVVTFEDLENENSYTRINGGNIITDNLMLNRLFGREVYLYTKGDQIAAILRLQDASSWDGQKIVIESGAIELSGSGHIFLASGTGGSLEVGDFEVQVKGDLIPNSGNQYNCGTYGFPWRDIYTQDGTVSSSDRAGKKEIDYDMSRYGGLFDRLRPCTFLRKNGTSGRRHHGFVAQDMEEALEAEGMSGMDFAGFVKWSGGDGGGYGVRYEEIIAMLVHEVQELKKEVNLMRKT